MSNNSAKLLFVVALGLNVVLWSRSRYAEVLPAHTSTAGLIKRFLEGTDDEPAGEVRSMSSIPGARLNVSPVSSPLIPNRGAVHTYHHKLPRLKDIPVHQLPEALLLHG